MTSTRPEPGTSPVWEQTVRRPSWPHFADPAGAPTEVDVAVVGGGLAGLSAALHLLRAHPDTSVAILEADRIGAGASGRSTGIVGPGVGGRIRSLRRRFGDAAARDIFRHSQQAVEDVVRIVRAEQLDCDLTPSMHLLCAGTQTQAARLARESRAFAGLGLDVPFLPAGELSGRLGHRAYHGALVYEPVVLVNPLKLTLGLAGAAERAGARIFEGSPVTAIDSAGGRVRIEIGGSGAGGADGAGGAGGPAVLHARKVVVATDGYTPPGLPHGRRIVSVRTHVLATRPLSAAERAELGWNGHEAVIDQRTFFAYYRLDAAGRLLFGGGPVCQPGAPAAVSDRIWRRLETELAALFPMLRAVPVEHRWSGLTGATLDRIPVVGEVPGQPGVVFAGAWTGHGLALSVGSGAWLAERLGGGSAPARYPWHRSHTRNPRFGPLQPAFVRSYVSALDSLDRGGGLLQRVRDGGQGRRADAPPTANHSAQQNADPSSHQSADQSESR